MSPGTGTKSDEPHLWRIKHAKDRGAEVCQIGGELNAAAFTQLPGDRSAIRAQQILPVSSRRSSERGIPIPPAAGEDALAGIGVSRS